jgi:glutathione S-transferase
MRRRMNNLPVEVKQIALHKADQRKPDYLAMNPLGKVPFLKDGDVLLPESSAIMMYLATKHK